MNLGKYSKFYVAIVGAGITLASVLYGSGNHWVVAAVAVASAIGVYAVPNAGYVEVKNEENAGEHTPSSLS